MQCIVTKEEAKNRLDKLLSLRYPDYSRTYFQNLLEEGLIRINRLPAVKRMLVQEGDLIEITLSEIKELSLEPEHIPLDILYEDDELLIINKPTGLVVHPGAGNPSHTLVNALLYHCKELPAQEAVRPGIVHRLDKETSGVLVAAKTPKALEGMMRLFAERKVEKIYYALCFGQPQDRVIKTFIGRDAHHRQKMAVKEEGKEAVTTLKTEKFNGQISLVSLRPLTGRTHQLRVHMQYIRHPILGDEVYGNRPLNKKLKIERLFLHAHSLAFTHPISGKKIEVSAPLPVNFNLD